MEQDILCVGNCDKLCTPKTGETSALTSRKADSNKIDKKANMCLTFEGLRG